MNEKCLIDCALYIKSSELDDFEEWIETDASSVLTPETMRVLEEWLRSNSDVLNISGLKQAFLEASKFHIYASAWSAIHG